MAHRFPMFRVQLVRERTLTAPMDIIGCPDDALPIFREVLEESDREMVAILLLNCKNRVTGFHIVSIGSLSASMIGTAEVFKAALLGNAASIMVAHNHPSGDPTPSPADIAANRSLVAAGKLLGIPVIDHLIIGVDGDYRSLAALEFVKGDPS